MIETNSIQFIKFEGSNVDEQINNFLETYSNCEIELLDIQYQQSSKRVNKQVAETIRHPMRNETIYPYRLVDEIAYSALVKYKINLNLKAKIDKKIQRQNELLKMGVDPTINLINKFLKKELPEYREWEGAFLYKNLKNTEYYYILGRDYYYNKITNQYEYKEI